MANQKEDRPATATYADHEIIRPVNKLSKAVSRVSVAMPGEDPVARAEEALAQLSSEFGKWMMDECERLDAARRQVKTEGFTKKNFDELFHSAHDIKGDAATFGYPLCAPAADSLCRVLEHSPDPSRIPVKLIDQHVDAIRAMVRENARPDAREIANVLTKRLRAVTDDFLSRENMHRPEVLAVIKAPPTAPDAA
ncbi:MAG: Hpt domain-containing protein [Pseudorhodoplanes sp.]|nr:Hpt domain-containing protein [Pseudorhodoplanes sp.]